MEHKRLFIAVDVSDAIRRAITEYVGTLMEVRESGVRWEKAEKIHLTLKFLGDTDTERLRDLDSALSAVASNHPSFELAVDGTGVFPNERKARVLWIGVRGNEPLQGLHRSIDAELNPIGFEKEPRTFSPHLTIGRIKDPRAAQETIRKHVGSAFGPIAFPVNEIVLYESKTLPTGSVYTVLGRYPLK